MIYVNESYKGINYKHTKFRDENLMKVGKYINEQGGDHKSFYVEFSINSGLNSFTCNTGKEFFKYIKVYIAKSDPLIKPKQPINYYKLDIEWDAIVNNYQCTKYGEIVDSLSEDINFNLHDIYETVIDTYMKFDEFPFSVDCRILKDEISFEFNTLSEFLTKWNEHVKKDYLIT